MVSEILGMFYRSIRIVIRQPDYIQIECKDRNVEIIAVLFAQIYHLGRFNENDFDLRLRFLVLCVSIWLDNISSSRGYEQVSLKENQKENKWDYLHERRS